MARRSLRPELNRIRGWVRQGRTDAWIAHELDVTVQQIQSFKREHGLDDDQSPERAGTVAADYDDEIDLRAEDDALIAAELEAAEAREAADEGELEPAERRQAAEKGELEADAGDQEDGDEDDRPGRRRRGRRGGRRGRRPATSVLEATFDHGEEGYGLWLDPSVQDNPIYAEYWAGHRPVEVTIDEDQIVIRRAGEDDADEDD
jgi:hypothetical protein